jgi:glycosyltransferase involved in cell wall biosynthesis
MSGGRPFVSVVTPTYNRRKFIPYLIRLYIAQTYPKDRMEWIILDDGSDKVGDLFEEVSRTIPNIRYVAHDTKLLIGQKRNMMNDMARGDIIVSMDDDDYYPPERVSHVVQRFAAQPRIELAGSSEMLLFFTTDKKIFRVGPYGPNHATNGTLAYRRSYLARHRYNEVQTHAEEKSFLDDYRNPMIQLEPEKTILVMCHADNTFDKNNLRSTPNAFMRETSIKIRGLIKDPVLREFYSNS